MRRSACRLPHGQSAPLFWDDDAAPKSMVVRLAMHGRWEWSGGFELQEREEYFGLRVHRVDSAGVRNGVSVILPVSISVEPSGVVLVSFKSQQNLPPYCIRNACTSVTISVAQDLVCCYPSCHPQGTGICRQLQRDLYFCFQSSARRFPMGWRHLQAVCRVMAHTRWRSTWSPERRSRTHGMSQHARTS